MDSPIAHTYDLDGFSDWLRSWGASPSTVTKRLYVARMVATTHPDPTTVTARDLATFLATPTFSAWTRTTYYGHLRSLFGWLHDSGLVNVDPTDKLRRPTPPANRPRPLTLPEARRVLDTPDRRLRAWLLLGMFAGLRAHETAKIHGADVTEQSIFVRGKGGKDAMIPTHEALWDLAKVMPQDQHWFPSPKGLPHINSATLTTTVTAHFAARGVAGSYHRCRHTYGTSLLRSGVNLRVVQDLMRHTSLATTAAYLAVDEDERREAIGRLGLVA